MTIKTVAGARHPDVDIDGFLIGKVDLPSEKKAEVLADLYPSNRDDPDNRNEGMGFVFGAYDQEAGRFHVGRVEAGNSQTRQLSNIVIPDDYVAVGRGGEIAEERMGRLLEHERVTTGGKISRRFAGIKAALLSVDEARRQGLAYGDSCLVLLDEKHEPRAYTGYATGLLTTVAVLGLETDLITPEKVKEIFRLVISDRRNPESVFDGLPIRLRVEISKALSLKRGILT